jgi:hypothetical protein
MIAVRKANDRGHADHGWLNTWHTFSFAGYYDPAYTEFSVLRVINEDRVQPGMGFGAHSHRDMEIITYILEGALEHRDSMGNGTVIRAGEVQRMSAGTGITHSEFNPSGEEIVHFFQIWIFPDESSLTPGYEQKFYSAAKKKGRLRLIASRGGRDGSLAIHQDADLFAALLASGDELTHHLRLSRHAWIQVAEGRVLVNDLKLEAGDGAAISDERQLDLKAEESSEILLFDLP